MTWSRRSAPTGVEAWSATDRPPPDPGTGRPSPSGPGVAVLIALVQAVGTALASRGGSGPGVGGYVLLVVGGLALSDRHQRPRITVVVVAVLTVSYHALGNPVGVTTTLAAVFAAGAAFTEGRPRAVWVVAAASFVALFFLDALSTAAALTLAGWLLGAGILLQILIMVAGLLSQLMREQRRLHEERQRRRASDERLRIAQELHDVLGHHLSLINVRAGVGLHLMAKQPQQPQAALDALDAIQQTSAEALREVQSVLTVLYPTDQAAPRAPAPGLDRLDDLTLDAGIPVRTAVTGDAGPLPAEIDRAAYRIVQEALTNVRRHAGSTATVSINLDYTPSALTVRVEDDGGGRPLPAEDAEDPVPGNGITGMRERAAVLGGTVETGRTEAGGWRVNARFPLPEAP